MFHLALSEDKKFWRADSKNLYLGPWILPEILKEKFSEFDLTIFNWHWDNLDKYYDDTLKINQSYENLISKIAKVLNELHGLNWNLRAWKILCGPWLRRYLNIIFERNENISNLYQNYDLTSCAMINKPLTDLQVKDFEDFSKKYKNEDYNNIIYIYILKKIDARRKINFKKIDIIKKNKLNKYKKKNNLKSILKKVILSNKVKHFLSYFSRKNSHYLQAVYLKNKFEKIKLNIKLGNIPDLNPIKTKTKDEKKFDENLRKKFYESIKKKIDTNNFFANLAVELIYYMFPRCYLENFEINEKFSSYLFQNYKPKIIIDSASYQKDEIFKIWLAKKIQDDSKLIILQHGGYYENFKFEGDFISHELYIADKYISWGWKKNSHNVETTPCQIPFTKKQNLKDKGIVNIVLRTAGSYANNLSTHDIPYKNAEAYIQSIIDIANSINNNKKLRFFLHPGDSPKQERGFSLRPYLEKKLSNKNIYFHYGEISKFINDTNLNIFTYLGTPYNQAMCADIPCLVYNNENYEPLNDKYRMVYDSMIRNNLMHTSILSLSHHINENSDHFVEWWNKSETINSRNIFCENFSQKPYSLENLNKTIKN